MEDEGFVSKEAHRCQDATKVLLLVGRYDEPEDAPVAATGSCGGSNVAVPNWKVPLGHRRAEDWTTVCPHDHIRGHHAEIFWELSG